MKSKFCILFITVAFSLNAFAVSFNCNKATTKVEKLVCSDKELSELDELLAKKFKIAMGKTTDKKNLKSMQLTWLKSRNQCADPTCIRDSYEERIGVLEAITANSGSCPVVFPKPVESSIKAYINSISDIETGVCEDRKMAQGDIDGDQVSDLVVASSHRGVDGKLTSSTPILMAFLGESYIQIKPYESGNGNPEIKYISNLRISDRIIYFDNVDYAKDDPMCCPSLKSTVKVGLQNQELKQALGAK
jgi:uncharacterized protein